MNLSIQIVQVTALDLDTGNNARLSYRLQGSGPFRVSPNTGWIVLAGQLDRETLDRYSLTVLATDNGSPAATASASVLVSVLDDNDNEPRFERELYAFELLENLPSGVLVGTVSASDPDLGKNAQLRYAVVQANSSFAVDPDTGEFLPSLVQPPPPHILLLQVRTYTRCLGRAFLQALSRRWLFIDFRPAPLPPPPAGPRTPVARSFRVDGRILENGRDGARGENLRRRFSEIQL